MNFGLYFVRGLDVGLWFGACFDCCLTGRDVVEMCAGISGFGVMRFLGDLRYVGVGWLAIFLCVVLLVARFWY